MNRTKIDWPNLDYTWNPVVGCRRNCSYCYAKRMNTRFKWIPEWTKPQFFPERLREPLNVRKQSTIFVGSISDICYWENLWIRKVINECISCFGHTFMFLTKDPTIYCDIYFPSNCMLGGTITQFKNVFDAEIIAKLCELKNKTFLSIEPLLGIVGEIPKDIDLVIVGAMTGVGAIKPKKEWIDSIKHPNIYFKSNIRKYINEQHNT